jgi:hypothetical protein
LANIEKSIAQVTEEIGAPCPSFAFPNGNYTAELAQHAVCCGAKTVMTTEPQWADQSFPVWRLPRVQIFGEDSPGKITLKIAIAATGSLLQNPDGTGREYRAIHRAYRATPKGGSIHTEAERLLDSSHCQSEAGIDVGIH